MKNCFECGYDTIDESIMLRVVNSKGDTLYLTDCINEAIKFMEQGGFCSLSCYKIEVIKVGGQ